ncbi:MAG: Flp pilus assembly complex ATPase component TadA [Alicyclobacillus herbarius]|uniref:ATPase, T2SS/T4P/T4SS family n=1 Tax=Alicyclobacillus herbarius TaxID=122960 RepID=UPI002355F8CE|nr:ATPase, T2SS/T4P/T4SS family [Alicyclobacillus herbarius]MCL6633556.1 Flp pilus assembly complex ATPase component TadA [Alicyclobacillus herbarius]
MTSPVPIPPVPWQITGNHWIVAPCIHPADGSIYALGALHRGARAAVEFSGGPDFVTGKAPPLARPTLEVDGSAVELSRVGLAWERVFGWIPTFTASAGQLLVRATIFAPYGRDADMPGLVYTIGLENRGAAEVRTAIGLQGSLACRHLRVRTAQTTPLRVLVQQSDIGPVIAARDGGSEQVSMAIVCDGEYVLFRNEPILVIRRFGHPWTLDELQQTGMFTPRMRDYLALIPQIRDSFLIGGTTGTGKSTLQNAMMAYIPQDELTWVLEDTPDAKVLGGFYGRMWTQEANGEGKGEITIERNLFDLKRMNPQNAIVGEMRDGQAAMRATDVAMMTSGLFSSTIHATSAEKMVQVYVNMLMSSGENPKYERALDLFAASFQQLISVELVKTKLPDGSTQARRLVTTISEVEGTDTNRVNWRPVFERQYRTRKVLFHGLSERMLDRAYKYGIEIPESLTQPGEERF